MNAKELIEAAKRAVDWYVTPNTIGAHRNVPDHVFYAGYEACRYILATVRPDDDEPVTRESCLAMGARIFGPRRYWFEVAAGRAIVVDMTEPDVVESEVYIMDDEHRVTLKWNPTNHDLRRLVATLWE